MKRKRTPAQRRASMANLAKARRKRAGAAAPKKRRAKRATPKRKRARAAAPRKHRKHVRRRARAQAAAPKRRRRSRRRQARDYEMSVEHLNQQTTNGRSPRRRGGSVKKKKRASRRRGRRVTSRTSTHKKRRTQRKRHFTKVRRGKRAGKRRVNRSRSRRHLVKGHKRGNKFIKRHYSYEAGAMENPLSTGEVVVVGLLGVLGAVVAQGADRFLATHALTGTIAADGSGLTDSPGKGQDYNANSVNAPMGLVRWAVAAGLSIVPIVGAHYVKSPMGRTSLQAVGFGALIRTGLKGGSDLVAWVTRKTAMGQRLFAPEIMAHAADKAFAAQVKTQPDMQLPPMGPLGGTSAAMLAQNVNPPPCNDCDKQKGLGAPPPPPPPAAPLYTPPAAPPAPATPPAAHSNGVNLAGRLYNPHARD